MMCVAGAEEIKDSTLDCMALPTSKAFKSLARVTSPDVFSAAHHDTVRQHHCTCSIASVYSDSRKRSRRVRYDCRQWTPLCVLIVISCVGAGKQITWRNSVVMLCPLFVPMPKSKSKIDFLTVRGIVMSGGCNTRSSPAVHVIIHVFHSSVRSHIVLKIITSYRTYRQSLRLKLMSILIQTFWCN